MNLPANASVPIISLLVGAAILFFGRRLFWLFVAAVGFAAGVELAPHLIHEPTPLTALTMALILGFIGALLAMFLQKIAVAVVGFVAGGRLGMAIVAAFLVPHGSSTGITFVIGGVIGALLLLALFDWALIVLSSVVGAHLIGGVVALPQTGATILFVALSVVGILVQTTAFRRRRAIAAD